MINKITIKNFKSHEDTVIELHPHVNVIVGKGQAGKTNIKRAVEWVKDNRPLGTGFISWWADGKPTMVELEVPTYELGPLTISMTKVGDGSAVYQMATGNEVLNEFKKFGSKVPEPVKRALNLDAVNMQAQLEQPFLVTGSKGEISRAVNRVIQAEIADRWLSELNSREAQNRQHIRALEAVIEVQQVNMDRLAPVYNAEEWIIKAEQTDIKLGTVQRRATNIAIMLEDLAQADLRINIFAQVIEPAEQYINAAEAAQAAIDEHTRITDLIADLWEVEARINALMASYQAQAGRYIELLEELGQCPTCLSPVDENIITQLKEEL